MFWSFSRLYSGFEDIFSKGLAQYCQFTKSFDFSSVQPGKLWKVVVTM